MAPDTSFDRLHFSVQQVFAADPLELAEIKRRWESYINQLPDYAYLCKDLLNGKM